MSARNIFQLTLIGALGMSATGAYASSFALQEYSVRDLGQANAGFSALAEDASTVFSNPAGLTRLKQPELVFGAVGVFGHARFDDRGSTLVNTAPQTGVEDRGFVGSTALGNFYAALPVSERVTLGLGVTTPFGILIDYDPHWIGRYQATNSTISSFDINPAIAIKLTDKVSLGLGISAQYFKARLTNAIDGGLLLGGGAASGTDDGSVDLQGSDWAVGFNAGLLADLTPKTRIGVHFRSKVEHELKGEADFTVNPLLSATYGGAFTDTDVKAGIDLPASYAFSIHHDVNDRLALMGSVLYTRWSSFRALNVSYANPAQAAFASTERFNSENTVRVAIGGRYKLCDTLSLSAGLAFDQSPIVAGFETARIPDSDRYIGALGFAWAPKPGLSVDFAYQRLELADLNIDRTGALGDQLRGQYDTSADLVGLAVRAQF